MPSKPSTVGTSPLPSSGHPSNAGVPSTGAYTGAEPGAHAIPPITPRVQLSWRWTKLDRYLAKEIIVPHIVTCALVMLVVGLSQLVKMATEVSGLGISVWDLVAALPYAMPTFLGMGMPAAFLLALVIAFGRMAEDRELAAMASVGISARRILLVPLLIAVGLTVLGTYLSAILEPEAVRALRNRLVSSAASYFANSLEPKVIHDELPELMIYLGERDELTGEMRDIVLADDSGDHKRLITAQRGAFDYSHGSHIVLALEDGEVQMGKGGDPQFRRMTFGRLDYDINADIFVRRTTGKVPLLFQASLGDIFAALKDSATDANTRQKYALLLHRKFSFPLAHIIFVLLVFPFATDLRHPSRFRAYAISGLLATGYYLLAQAPESLSGRLGMSPWLATWTANILFGVIGLILTARRLRS